jgi:hypothetical protein
MCKKILLSSCILFCFIIKVFGQANQLFSLSEDPSFQKVCLKLTSGKGVCLVKPAKPDHPFSVYSSFYSQGREVFQATPHETYLSLWVDVHKLNEKSHPDNFAYDFISKLLYTEEQDLEFFLDPHKTFRIDMQYGIGKLDLDLSGLRVEKLKINTGSANVKIGYDQSRDNMTHMDTLMVKVDFGSVDLRRVGHARADLVMADVGFGNVYVDCSTVPKVRSQIRASVGAGNLKVKLPEDEVPIIIYVKDSQLCHYKACKGFKELSPNVFINNAYQENAENLLTLYLEVALGNISFK